MPWTPNDAMRHTKLAKSRHLQELWARTANAALDRGEDDASAIRIANSVVGNQRGEKGKPRQKRTRAYP